MSALPQLVSLDVSYCEVQPSVAEALLTGLSHLTSLAMNGVPGVDERLWRSAARPLQPVEAAEVALARAAAGDAPMLDSGAAAAVAGDAGGACGLRALSLVRCAGLRSMCLGLRPASEGPGGPALGPWLPAGCAVSQLRSLRLGLSAVQVSGAGAAGCQPRCALACAVAMRPCAPSCSAPPVSAKLP